MKKFHDGSSTYGKAGGPPSSPAPCRCRGCETGEQPAPRPRPRAHGAPFPHAYG